METSFLELRCKEVVNVIDGRKLGHIVDIVFDLMTARVLGLVVPGEKSLWNVFKNSSQIFIPFGCVIKIGEDTILVELREQGPPNNPFILNQPPKEEK